MLVAAVGPASAEVGTANSALASLVVQSESSTPYSRAAFEHWIDADGDGCDTRAEVLIAESLVPVTFESGCRVTTGQWLSYYDGATWTDASDVDVDHMVPLAEVWQSGAWSWTATERRDYANDIGVDHALEVVTDNVNQSKSAGDAADWLPPLSEVTCRYITAMTLVKFRYSLSIDPAEQTALRAGLDRDGCGARSIELPARYAQGAPPEQVTPPPAMPVGPVARTTELACPPGQVPPAGFADLNPASVHAASVDCLIWWGVAQGRTASSYAPGGSVTRAQMATFIANTITQSGGVLPEPQDRFADDNNSRHQPNINALAAAGIVAGRADGSYGPDEAVSRAAMATFLVRAIEYRTSTPLPVGADAFADDAGNVHEANINKAAAAGLTGGSNGAYNPGGAVTREQMASFIARTLDLLVADSQATQVPPANRPAPLPEITPPPVVAPPIAPPPVVKPPVTVPADPGDSKNCGDFRTYREAKTWFDLYYPTYGDVAKLDGNNDLIPCQNLPGAP